MDWTSVLVGGAGGGLLLAIGRYALDLVRAPAEVQQIKADGVATTVETAMTLVDALRVEVDRLREENEALRSETGTLRDETNKLREEVAGLRLLVKDLEGELVSLGGDPRRVRRD